jgi:hypothetical protein
VEGREASRKGKEMNTKYLVNIWDKPPDGLPDCTTTFDNLADAKAYAKAVTAYGLVVATITTVTTTN